MSKKEDIEKLYRKAIQTAQRRGFAEIAEDFAGWIAVKWLEGKAQHQTLGQSLIDFLRLEYGNTGGRCGADALLRARRQKETAVSGCDEFSVEDNLDRMFASSSHIAPNDPRLAELERQYFDPTRHLNGRDLLVWTWKAKGNVSLKEIASWLGVTESRASQILTSAKRKIIQFEGIRQMRERIEDGQSSFEVEWITL